MGVGPPHTIEEVTEGDEVMEKRGRQDGITTEQAKGRTQRWQPLLPNLQRVNEAARSSGQTRFTALLHHVDVAALERAFRRQRRAASPGMDRVTVDDYERELEANLRRLHDSIHSGQYWPKPVRRTYIPKADGGRRPLGIPALEDKIVQGAVAEVLNAVYEADFMGFSYGFRPERSPHAALAALDKALMTQRVDWVLDVDIRTFFESMPRDLIERAVAHHTDLAWVKLYVGRWLRAPIEHPDGTRVERTKGPARRRRLAASGQPLPALRVRSLDGAGLPGPPVRALRGRCPRPLPERGGGAVRAGGDPGSSGGLRSGASSHEDPDRLLQGRRPAGDARTHRVRLPRLHLPTATGEEPVGAILRQLPAGDQHQGRDGDPADRPRLADGVHQEQPAPGGSGSPCEPGGAGLAELLRAVLSLAVRSGAPSRE